MAFLKFKLVCYCNGVTPTDMALIDDDMEWVFECPKCRTQIGVQNWTNDSTDESVVPKPTEAKE